jgi:hypothetical protein
MYGSSPHGCSGQLDQLRNLLRYASLVGTPYSGIILRTCQFLNIFKQSDNYLVRFKRSVFLGFL